MRINFHYNPNKHDTNFQRKLLSNLDNMRENDTTSNRFENEWERGRWNHAKIGKNLGAHKFHHRNTIHSNDSSQTITLILIGIIKKSFGNLSKSLTSTDFFIMVGNHRIGYWNIAMSANVNEIESTGQFKPTIDSKEKIEVRNVIRNDSTNLIN